MVKDSYSDCQMCLTMVNIQTTEYYWDCECVGMPEGYIHPKSQTICIECGEHQDDMPDSRVEEVYQVFGHYGEKENNNA